MDYEDEYEENIKARFTLPRLHEGQKTVIRSKAKYKVLMCGRRWGKSFLAAFITILKMIDGKSVAYVTPTYSLGKAFYNELFNFIPKNAIAYQSATELEIRLSKGGKIKFFSGDTGAATNIRGRSFDLIIFDEAAHIPNLKEIWKDIVEPTMATTDGEAMFVSTPNGLNAFHDLYEMGLDPYEDEYKSFHFPSHTSPFVSKKFLEKRKKDTDENTFRQEYLAEPLSSADNPFGIDHIRNNTIDTLSNKETIVYGADIAKHNDWTVIIGLDEDGCMTFFERFRGEWTLSEQKIKDLPKTVMKVIDATGVGDYMFERLQQSAENIVGFKFTAKSKPAIMRELIVDVQQGNLKFNTTTSNEMKAFTYSTSTTGHPIYQAASGKHDDTVCALAMANHYRKQAYGSLNWTLYTC